jgi:hypothetical protein
VAHAYREREEEKKYIFYTLFAFPLFKTMLVTLLGWVQARQLGTFGEKLVFFFFSAGV